MKVLLDVGCGEGVAGFPTFSNLIRNGTCVMRLGFQIGSYCLSQCSALRKIDLRGLSDVETVGESI